MRHSMFYFILDLKNIQTNNKWKTQDYTIVQNSTKFDLNCELYFINVFFFVVTKGINRLY